MNFSFLHLLFESGWFIQLLSFALLAGSIWVWAVMVEKWKTIKEAFILMDTFEADFFSKTTNLDMLYTSYKSRLKTSPLARLFLSVMGELKKARLGGAKNGDYLKERVEKLILTTTENEMMHLQQRLDVLSVASSTAPFVGLFGTVWGIMQSFSAMGSVGNANLSVIAPGIATALSTTALGLIVAIPAAIGAHYFKQKLEKFENRLIGFGIELEMLISRQLEEGKHAF
ncbi:MAG: MotA/TolQ/ExbB proton channel family protein [Alphaproteobacteria bacterium]|nr:MotA/TolQ/ExbB proton channel family protein [Alphaproteobacteria bacterium]MBN2779525.1 MotA/TolQ/ExbB proton channel family protein [Alphaproteobacteria bacterium]